MSKRVLVGMSGGVDSSVAAACLLEKGFEVAGCTLRLFDNGDDTASRDAAEVCKTLGIKHFTLDFREDFRNSVIADFIEQYTSGKTPNPCIVCNKKIKFERLLKFAEENGFDYIATGHYSKISKENGKYILSRAEDLSKDQTYMLYRLSQSELSKTLFPLAALSKAEAREIATRYGFSNADKPDSQDICFVPSGDYAAFIEGSLGEGSPRGNYIDTDGNILGEHNGIIRYTVGQRKGLGIALGKPAFVLSKDAQSNTVTLSCDESLLFCREVYIENLNFISGEFPTAPIEVNAKLRYRQAPCDATLTVLSSARAVLNFKAPQRAPSAGQAAVFYSGDILLGGGTII